MKEESADTPLKLPISSKYIPEMASTAVARVVITARRTPRATANAWSRAVRRLRTYLPAFCFNSAESKVAPSEATSYSLRLGSTRFYSNPLMVRALSVRWRMGRAVKSTETHNCESLACPH